ncbi:DMT family transporter [bacterium]|nr:MAG: DMT family transporter [bacterium]
MLPGLVYNTCYNRLMPSIALATLIFGTTFVVIRAVLIHAGPWTLLADRYLLAALVGVGALAVLGLRPTREEWRWGIILGVIAAAMQATNTIGLETTTASKSAFICAGYIALVPLVALVAMRHVPRSMELAAAAVALLGTGLLTVRWPLERIVSGDLWTLGTALFAALSIVATKMAIRRSRSLVLVVIQAAVVALVCAAGAGLSGEGFGMHGLAPWLGTLYLGTVASLGAFALAAHGQRVTSPVAASVVFGMEPLVATLLGAVALGERMGAAQAAGAALMLGAGWIVAWDGRRRRAAEALRVTGRDNRRREARVGASLS